MLSLFVEHANLLKALAHPKRLEIVNLLRDQSLSVCEIQSMLNLPQANLSQHLTILRDNNIVKTTKNGKQIIYQLAHPNFLLASDLLREILSDKPLDNFPQVIDPVCGMSLTPKQSAASHKHEGKIFYFCASGCHDKFIKSHPQK